MKIKHLLLVAILTLTTVATAVAQAPLSFTYQAVVRNSSGRLVSNATVGVKISIVRDSATGRVVYSGVQRPRTNANGLFSIVIGNSQNGIDTITWRNGPYFLKSEVDPNGGTNYTLTSVQQMLSVPYALHAHTVDSIIGGVNFIERQVLSMNGDTVFLTGGSYVVLPPSFSGNYNDLTNKPTIPTVPTNVSAFTNDAGYLTNATLTETQVLSIRHDTVFLTGGSFVKLPASFSGNYNDLTNKPVLFSGVYDSLTNKPTNVSSFTNDAGYLTSYTETQVLSMRHDTVFLTGGSFVKLPAGFSGNYNDLTNKPTIPTVPTNVSAFTNDAGYLTSYTETQVLSMRHDTVFLTGGSFVKLPAGFSGNYNDLTNKPTIPTVPTNVSAFTNDAGYLTNATLTETQVLSIRHDTVFLTGGSFVKLPAGFSGNYNDLTNKPTIPTVPTNVSAFTNDAGYLTNATLTETQVLSIRHDTVFLTGGSFVKLPAGFSGNYNDLTNKPTIPTVPTNVSAFTNDAGYLTSYTETQVLSIRHDTVFLTGGSFVKLPAGFSGNYNDLTNKPTIPTVPTNVSAFTNDAGYLTNATLTETQVLSIRHDTVFLTGGSFVKLPTGFSGNYNDLTNKPTIPTVPTNVSAFTNDAGYLTNATLTETQVLSIRHDTVFLTGGSFVKLPAGFSGNYNDLTNKPTIPTVPTNVSAFTNDAGYLTNATLTETQVLSIRHDTVFLTGGSFVKLPAGFSGNYNDLTNKPTIPTVPTNVSAFTNDAGYLTNATLTETQVLSIRHDTVFLTGGSFVKLPAGFSGNYNDLTNKPTIPTVPTNVSAFTNDAGYLTNATLAETQVLTIRHDTIFLTGGSFVALPSETQNLSDVATNNDSVNSQIKNLYDPTDSMDAVNLRTLNAVISRLDSIITYQNRVIDTLNRRLGALGATAGDTTAVVCERFNWYGTEYTTSGNYQHVLQNTAGFDSVITLHLTVNNGTFNAESQTACNSYTWHGNNYTANGTYTYNYINVSGCPSIDTLHLTVNSSTHNVESASACSSYTWHGTTYTTSGLHIYNYNNALGCPSCDTLNLTIGVSVPVIQEVASPGASYGVSISCATSGAEIYYTTNGTTPSVTALSTYHYTSTFNVSHNQTVKAIAIKDGCKSSVVSRTF